MNIFNTMVVLAYKPFDTVLGMLITIYAGL